MTAPKLPRIATYRISSFLFRILQQGHATLDPDMVPPPATLSAALRCAVVPVGSGTLRRTEKSMPFRSTLTAISSNTRFPSFLQSQRVFSSGIVARHDLQGTVRAQRYATVGLTTQRGSLGSRRSPGQARRSARQPHPLCRGRIAAGAFASSRPGSLDQSFATPRRSDTVQPVRAVLVRGPSSPRHARANQGRPVPTDGRHPPVYRAASPRSVAVIRSTA